MGIILAELKSWMDEVQGAHKRAFITLEEAQLLVKRAFEIVLGEKINPKPK